MSDHLSDPPVYPPASPDAPTPGLPPVDLPSPGSDTSPVEIPTDGDVPPLPPATPM